MNVKFILSISLLSFSLGVYAQKKPLDHSVYDSWQSLSNMALSENGHWISYSIEPQVGDNLLVIENPGKGKKIIIPRATKAAFTKESDFLVCTIKPSHQLTETTKQKVSDTLAVLNLQTTELWKSGGIQSFFLNSGNWITYRPSARPESLSVRNLLTGEEFDFDKVQSYKFSGPANRLLLLLRADKERGQSYISVKNFSTTDLDTLISEQGMIRNFTLSNKEERLAYLLEDNQLLQIRLYNFISREVEDILSDNDLPDSLRLNPLRPPFFSENGKRLYFGVKKRRKKNARSANPNRSSVEIWRYNDTNYYPSQVESRQFGSDRDYLSVYNFSLSNYSILEQGIIRLSTPLKSADNLLAKSDFYLTEASQWMGAYNREFDLYSINPDDGNTTVIEKSIASCSGADAIQVLDKYFIWYDCARKDYFAWDGESNQNITEKIPVPLYDINWDKPGNPLPYGIMGWVVKDSAVLIYDQFDIWKVDIIGTKQPVNLTNGIGRKENMEIRNATKRHGAIDTELDPRSTILLKTFSFKDRSSGLGILTLGLQDYVQLKLPGAGFYIDFVSQSNDKIIYTKESYQNSPDLYYAYINPKDHTVKESKISSLNLQQSNYNWGTSELYHWTTFNGHQGEGVLFKPENFDPDKKYPVICHYYEGLNVRGPDLNRYEPPSPSRQSINIPYFVSRGYVVFVPGISFTLGETCDSTYDFVVSGVESLIKEGFIDENKMGIQGGSFGGYETFCLITKTNIFKAAWASVPVGNLITQYGLTHGLGGASHGLVENGQFRMNAKLWDDVGRYIKNSPYFHLENVTTPTVIVSNDNDPSTRVENGIEMFLGMRRLEKEVWLLTYRGERHALDNRKNQLDLQKRMSGYFEYYLKDCPPPIWLTEDIE